MSAIPREERILNLLAALLAARTPLPFSDIRGRVSGYDDDASEEALEKRFDRDKKDLRTLGVPLEFVAEDRYGRSGYLIPRDRFFLREIRFDLDEGIALAAIERAVRGDPGDSFTESLRSALAKVCVDSPLQEALRESVVEQQLLDPHVPSGGSDEPGHLGELAGALAGRRAVRFTYFTLGSGETAERTVEPYGVGFSEGHWYLVGRDVVKGEERVFRTSRIRGEVELLEPTGYEIPEGFDLRARLGHRSWEMGEGREIRARVRFGPEISWMIAENLRTGQSYEAESDGGGVLTAPTTDPAAFVRWVASYGPMARVLSPPALVDRMREHLKAVVGRHEP